MEVVRVDLDSWFSILRMPLDEYSLVKVRKSFIWFRMLQSRNSFL